MFDSSSIHPGTAVQLLAAGAVAYTAIRGFYLAYLHPLAKIPGPKYYALADFVYLSHVLRGDWPHVLKQLHDKYGPTVRYGPNEVSFIEPEAWKTICGHKAQSARQFDKEIRFYNKTVADGASIIVSNNDDHKRMRRVLAHAFSEKALRGQEDVLKHYIDLFMLRMSQRAGTPVNMVQWYNFTTFDLIGDLAFGKPFGLLEKGDYNPWISLIFETIRLTVYGQFARRHPMFNFLVPLMAPAKTLNSLAEHGQLSREIALQRVKSGNMEREDFVSYILKHNDEKGLTENEIVNTAVTLITAGSETTATMLSGTTFYLLKNPDVYNKLVAEIRNAFQSEDEITMSSVNNLQYLLAVFNEAFRMYPPVPTALHRLTPEAGENICGYFCPEGTVVAVPHWSAYQSELNWREPQRFIPERWLGDPRFADDKRDVLQPFSYGPRNCIGKNLAYAEMRVILTRVLYRFDLELMPESNNWNDQKVFTLWEKDELMCKLHPRADLGAKRMSQTPATLIGTAPATVPVTVAAA